MTLQHILLHLSLIDGIGPSTINRILAAEDNSAALAQIYYASVQDCVDRYKLSFTIAQRLVEGLRNVTLLAQELQLIERYAISWATILDDNYPPLLKTIHAAPIILYWQGNAPIAEKALALVGSRQANSYGQSVIERLVPDLVQEGWAIVSGGALGIDSLVHQRTMLNGGTTYVVLGSGLLKPYPASNKKLFQDVLDSGGTLLSSFPLKMEALPGNFPARNRIIAGLCLGTVVIQAAAQSGALITANFALEQGREVAAVPGSINDPLSNGCHALLQQGAALVVNVQDILQLFGHNSNKKETVQQMMHLESNPETNIASKKQATITDNSPSDLIIRECAQPCSFEDLLQLTNISMPELTSLLFDLQVEGKIGQNFAGMWEIIRR